MIDRRRISPEVVVLGLVLFAPISAYSFFGAKSEFIESARTQIVASISLTQSAAIQKCRQVTGNASCG
jgi:hypothetical protein